MIKLEDIATNLRERTLYQSFYEFGRLVDRTDVIPGHYYSFDYPVPNFKREWIPDSREEWKEDKEAYLTDKQHYNMNPIGLTFFHDNWQQQVLLLDIKIIPPKYRAALIMAHINIIKESLDKLNAFSKGKITPLSERKKMNLSLHRITPSILEQYSGIKIGYAITGLKLDKVMRATLLDWDKVGELPLANIDTRGLEFSPRTFDVSSIFEIFENKQLL